jgi:hypothetical protein
MCQKCQVIFDPDSRDTRICVHHKPKKYATLWHMNAPALPQNKGNESSKPFTGIKRLEIKALRPNQLSVVELFKRVRGQ